MKRVVLATGWSGRPPGSMRRNRNLIIVGIVLLVIGGLSVYESNATRYYQSTFNVLPLKYFKIGDNLPDQTTISGSFQETSGRQITFYILTSVQYAAYQIGQPFTSLFSRQNVPSGSVSFTFNSPDTYYMIFTHGTGLLNATETVSFQRTYLALDRFQFAAGIVLLGLGAVEVFWGRRPNYPCSAKPSPSNLGPSNAKP